MSPVSWPHATVYRPAADGRMTRTDELDCGAEQVVADAKDGRAYVLTSDSVVAVDHGAPTAELPLAPHAGIRCLAERRDGGVILGEEERLRFLDPNLHPTGQKALGFRPHQIETRPDGTLLVRGESFDHQLVHLSPSGRKTLFESGPVKLGSEVRDADGSLWYVSDGDVHHYDPASRRDDSFYAGREASVAVPLGGDRQLVVQDRLADPELELRADGFTRKTVDFGGDCHLRQLCVTADGQSAYVTVSRHPRERPTERTMYRVPLDPDASWSDPDKQEIYHTASSRGNFIPAVLDDGRVAILGQEGLELLAADGRSLGRFDTLADLRAAIGLDARVVSRRIDAGGGSESAIAPGWAAHVRKAVDEGWIPAPPPAEDGSRASLADDGVARFQRTESEADAGRELGPEVGTLLQRMQTEAPAANRVLQCRAELPYGDGARVVPGAGDLQVLDAHGEAEKTALKLDHDVLTAVLPVTASDGHCVAAGTGAGDVYWLHGEDASRFSLGEPVKSLALLPGDRLAALGDHGAVMILEPGAKDLRAPSPPPAPGKIEQQADAVVINGVRVPKLTSGR